MFLRRRSSPLGFLSRSADGAHCWKFEPCLSVPRSLPCGSSWGGGEGGRSCTSPGSAGPAPRRSAAHCRQWTASQICSQAVCSPGAFSYYTSCSGYCCNKISFRILFLISLYQIQRNSKKDATKSHRLSRNGKWYLTSSCAFSSFFVSPPFSNVFRLSRKAFTTSVGDLEDFPNSGNILDRSFSAHTLSIHLEGTQSWKLVVLIFIF